MNREDIQRINVDRLANWGALLTKTHSTPAVLVGVGHDHNSGVIRVIAPEDMPDEYLQMFIRYAYHMIEAGRETRVGETNPKEG